MGAIIKEVNGQPSGEVDGEAKGRGTGESSESASATDTRTKTGSGDTRRGSGDTRSGDTQGEAEKVVSQLVTVNDEDKKREERNAKRRERYAKQKEANGGQVKPRKVNKNTKSDKLDTTQINALLITLSAIVASRPNMEHWLLTEKEVESITTPLCKMLEESEALAKVTENSNQIALVIACATVFMPRVVLTATKIKKQKGVEKDVRNKQIDKTKTDIKKSTGRNDGQPTTDGTNNRSNEPFYGLPIA